MNTIYLMTLLSMLLIAPLVVHANKSQSSATSKIPVGRWGVEIENEGKIGLNCKAYRENVSCEIFWFFTDFRVLSKVEDGILKIYTGDDENDALLVSLKDGQPDKFLSGGILTPQYFPHYMQMRFENFQGSGMGSYSSLKNKADKLYHERGSLQKLPDTFPSWVMNPAIHLFKNEKDGAYIGKNRVLAHPALTAETLQTMHALFSTNGKPYPSELPVIARNPSTSLVTLEQLFAIPDTIRLHAVIWNAISANPKAPISYRAEYYERIKSGNKKTQVDFLGDGFAPPDLLDWVARNSKHGFFRSRMYTHRNVTPETLDYLFEKRSTDEDKRRITEHPNVSDETLLKLAKVKLKSRHDQDLILMLILRHNDKGKEAVQAALDRLARDKRAGSQAIAAKDDRLNRELIVRLINSEAIQVRSALAVNQRLIYGDLVILANDDYAHVSKPARKQLKERFVEEYTQLSISLRPLTELNQAYNLSNVLKQNVIDNDIEGVKSTIQKLKRTGQSVYVDITPVLKSGNKALMQLLNEVTTNKFKKLVVSPDFNEDWLAFFMNTDVLKSLDQFSALSICLRANRLDYAQFLLDSGYDINASAKRRGENHFSTAIYLRSEEQIDFLLSHGINTDNVDTRSRQSPLNLAKKLNFFYAVEKLDKTGKYSEEVAAFKQEHAPVKNSPLIGDWSNLQGEFKTSNLSLNSDGTGKMMGAVGGALVTWKALKSGELVIEPVALGKKKASKKYVFQYELLGARLTLKTTKGKRIEYYRIDTRTASELLRTGDHNIDNNFIATWVDDEAEAMIAINADGTALVKNKIDYVWKKTPNNTLTAYEVKNNQLKFRTVITISLNKDKEVLLISKRSGKHLKYFKQNAK